MYFSRQGKTYHKIFETFQTCIFTGFDFFQRITTPQNVPQNLTSESLLNTHGCTRATNDVEMEYRQFRQNSLKLFYLYINLIFSLFQ